MVIRGGKYFIRFADKVLMYLKNNFLVLCLKIGRNDY